MAKEKFESLIKMLELAPHPEGGYFKQTYCSADTVKVPERYEGDERASSTCISYLLDSNSFSAWHKIKSDEIWHYYSGSPINLHIIDSDGNLTTITLGDPLLHENAVFNYCVQHDQWFCAVVVEPETYSLVGCTVSPGFDYRDWELADRNNLCAEYEEHKEIIEKYTRITSLEEEVEQNSSLYFSM